MSADLRPNENDTPEQAAAKLKMRDQVMSSLSFEVTPEMTRSIVEPRVLELIGTNQVLLGYAFAKGLISGEAFSKRCRSLGVEGCLQVEIDLTKKTDPQEAEVTREEIQGAGFIDGTDRTAQFLSLVTAKEFDEKEYEAWGKRMNRLNGEHHH